MKKIMLILLALLGVVVNVKADTVKKRIYVIADNNYQTYKKANLAAHISSTSGPLYEYGNSKETMGMLANYSSVYVYDFTVDTDKTYTFKVYDSGNTSWKSSEIPLNSANVYYYYFNSSSSDALESGGTVSYRAYVYNGTSWIDGGSFSTTDNLTYTIAIDNQTSYNSSLALMIAPSFAIDIYGNEASRWNMMYRPADSYQTPGFSILTDAEGGCYNGSTNKLNLSVAAHYDIQFKPFDWTFSVSPYFTREINASVGYATFSSAHDVVCNAEAYYASKAAGSSVSFSQYAGNKIPANQGALLKGSGTVTFTPAGETLSAPTTNFLKASVTDTELTTGDSPYNYILAGSNASDLGFYYVNKVRTSAAGKAYLQTTVSLTPVASARVAMVFNDESETTGIKELKSVKADGIFNLRGQRVMNAQKGLYIVNGKKMLMK